MEDKTVEELKAQADTIARELDNETNSDLAQQLEDEYEAAGWTVHVSRTLPEMDTTVAFEAHNNDEITLIELNERTGVLVVERGSIHDEGWSVDHVRTWREAAQFARGLIAE